MSYTTHNFQRGDLIRAADINEMDDQIELNEQSVNDVKANLVKVSDTQPSDATNKIWVKETPEAQVQVPTYTEFEALSDTVSNLKTGSFCIEGTITYNTSDYSQTEIVITTTAADILENATNDNPPILSLAVAGQQNQNKTFRCEYIKTNNSSGSFIDTIQFKNNEILGNGDFCEESIDVFVSSSSVLTSYDRVVYNGLPYQFLNSVATVYDQNSAYAVGDYVIYDNALYKCAVAKAEFDPWVAANWTAVSVTGEVEDKVSDLKADLNDIDKVINGIPITMEYGYIDTSGATVDITAITSSTNWKYGIVDCTEGDNFTINANSGNAPRAWCFVDNSGNSLAVAESNIAINDLILTAPANASKLIVHSNTGLVSYIGKTLDATLDSLETKVVSAENNLNEIDGVVNGVKTDAELTFVDGLYYTANATKYTAQASYGTYYFPIVKGQPCKLTFKSTSSNGYTAFIGYSTSVPAVNVAASYIGSCTVPARSTREFECNAPNDGYISMTWWKDASRTGTAIVIEGGVIPRITALETTVLETSEDVTDIQNELIKMYGQEVTLVSGNYYKSSPVLESTTESQIQTSSDNYVKRTMIELPAGKVLRLVGRGSSDAVRLFFVFDANTGILIDMPNANAQKTVQSWYLRYDVDTHIYINCHNSYEHFIQIVDNISSWIDISECYGQRNATVVELNGPDYITYAVRNIKRGAQGQTAPTVFIHCSDIHGDTLNLNRIMEFSKDPYISSYISDVICTGDIANVSLDEYGTSFLDDVTDGDKILVCPGNHDVATGTGSSVAYNTATPEQTYNALFNGKIVNWGVVQPENAATDYLGYFYKDYTATKIRAIFLDFNHSSEYINAQLTWFASVLQDAYDKDYSVLCLNHYMFSRDYCKLVDCTFSIKGTLSNEGSWTIPESAVSVVETFIGYGGKFICWLGGHVHNDFVLLHNNGHQMCIGVSTASYKAKQVQFCDNARVRGLKSQDLFNVVSIDTYSKKLSVLRVGSDLSRFMIPRRRMCIDYVNRTVLWSD